MSSSKIINLKYNKIQINHQNIKKHAYKIVKLTKSKEYNIKNLQFLISYI